MTKTLRVVIAAEESAGIQAVRMVVERGDRVVAVATTPGGHRERGAIVADAARALDLHVVPASSVCDSAFGSWLADRDVDLLLNVHSLHVACPEVVLAPAIGSFNLHPGPLPEYAGLNAPSWAIYNGESQHAVTVHWMTETVDAGPVAYEVRFGTRNATRGCRCSRDASNAGCRC